MTSKPVTQLNSFFSSVSNGKNGNEAAHLSGQGKFTQIMSSAAGKSETKMNTVKIENQSTSTVRTKAVVEKSNADKPGNTGNEISEGNAVNEKNTLDAKSGKAVEDAVKEVTDEIKDEIKTKLGVSEEELLQAMQALGLGMTDLMNPENIVAIAVELTGSEDATALLTDEVLYSSVKDVLTTVNEIMGELSEQLNISPEELQEKLTQMSGATKNSEVNPKEGLKNSVEGKNVDSDMQAAETGETEEIPVIVIKDETKSTVTNDKSQQSDSGELKAGVPDTSQEVEGAQVKDNGTGEENKSDGQNQESNSGILNFKEILNGNQDKVDMVAKAVTVSADAQEIMKQITNQIKITFQTEATKMEMELNPASLGKVGLQIESKGGVITAHFTAQNEAVKAAIESQAVELKENLVSQGVKIESVEVTVESHAFEKNMEQNGGNAQEENAQNNKSRKRTNLNLMSETDEELSAEDAMVRDIMIQSGNSVNYTA